MQIPIGAWQRDWIRRHGGATDSTVIVRYVQTPSVFGDLRIGANRPDLSHASSFAELSDAELAALATQNGFAGYTTVDGANATWHHEIDFQPADAEADIGRIEPAGEARMYEHALDGSYIESWSMLTREPGPSFAVKVTTDGRVARILAVAGDHFVYARARSQPLPVADSVTDAITQTHASRLTIIAYLDCEISHGTVHDWRIEHSTLPWREGNRLEFAGRIVVDAHGQPAPRDPAPEETWTFPVNTLDNGALRAMFGG